MGHHWLWARRYSDGWVAIDLGVPEKNIICVDPEFNVGRLGQYYSNVPSNTKTKLFVNFIKACKTFQECKSAAIDMLYTYDQDFEYPLRIIIDPLKDISDYLRTKVVSIEGSIQSLYFENGQWHIATQSNQRFTADNVVLATGSRPRSLDYQCTNEIGLDTALSKECFGTISEPGRFIGCCWELSFCGARAQIFI